MRNIASRDHYCIPAYLILYLLSRFFFFSFFFFILLLDSPTILANAPYFLSRSSLFLLYVCVCVCLSCRVLHSYHCQQHTRAAGTLDRVRLEVILILWWPHAHTLDVILFIISLNFLFFFPSFSLVCYCTYYNKLKRWKLRLLTVLDAKKREREREYQSFSNSTGSASPNSSSGFFKFIKVPFVSFCMYILIREREIRERERDIGGWWAFLCMLACVCICVRVPQFYYQFLQNKHKKK